VLSAPALVRGPGEGVDDGRDAVEAVEAAAVVGWVFPFF